MKTVLGHFHHFLISLGICFRNFHMLFYSKMLFILKNHNDNHFQLLHVNDLPCPNSEYDYSIDNYTLYSDHLPCPINVSVHTVVHPSLGAFLGFKFLYVFHFSMQIIFNHLKQLFGQ